MKNILIILVTLTFTSVLSAHPGNSGKPKSKVIVKLLCHFIAGGNIIADLQQPGDLRLRFLTELFAIITINAGSQKDHGKWPTLLL